MSRSGYSDDGHCNLWRGAVNRALTGARGQAFLREFVATLDAMPEKILAGHSFQNERGEVCSLGAVCAARSIPMNFKQAPFEYDGEVDRDEVGAALNIAPAMAAEVMYWNDEGGPWSRQETPAERWKRMRAWAVEHTVAP
jgi:hypothetical protein